jgi:hypothetical protein
MSPAKHRKACRQPAHFFLFVFSHFSCLFFLIPLPTSVPNTPERDRARASFNKKKKEGCHADIQSQGYVLFYVISISK